LPMCLRRVEGFGLVHGASVERARRLFRWTDHLLLSASTINITAGARNATRKTTMVQPPRN
jgi:hypothetical protein